MGMTPKEWREQLMHWRRTSPSWRNGLTKLKQWKMWRPTPGIEKHPVTMQVGCWKSRKQLFGIRLGGGQVRWTRCTWVSSVSFCWWMLNRSRISKNTLMGQGKWLFPGSGISKAVSKILCPMLDSPVQNTDKLDIQWRATRTVRNLEYKTDEEKLRAEFARDLIAVLSYLMASLFLETQLQTRGKK